MDFAFPSPSASEHGRVRRIACALGVALAAAAVPRAAGADEKRACMTAYVEAQKLRKQDHLVAARKQLIRCAKETCPDVLRKDCLKWLDEVETSLPSVVVEARTSDGRDLVEVRVLLDGKLLTGRLDGRAIPVDPGPHLFRFDFEGAHPIKQQVVIRQGDKERRLRVAFQVGGSSEPPSSGSGAASPPEGPDTVSHRPTPALVYVLGGVGVVGLAGFGVLAASFDGKMSDLDACKPDCDKGDVDAAESTRRLAFVSAGVGVASLIAAGTIYLTRPAAPRVADHARAVRLDVAARPGGAAAVVRGRF